MKGKEISLPADIVHIADVYDALTNERPYRLAMSTAEALAFIQADKKAYHPGVMEAFLEVARLTMYEQIG